MDNQNINKTKTMDPAETSAFHKRIFEAVANAKVRMIDESEIQDGAYHLEKRTYADVKSEDAKGVEDLSMQLSELSLLHPILVLEKEKQFYIVSGKKRLEAFRKSRAGQEDRQIPCKLLSFDSLFEGLEWSSEVKNGQLREALCNVSYSESAHNTQLSDETVVEFLRQIKENYGYEVELFELVMNRLGLKRDNPAYRNIKRLWVVAANDALYKAVSKDLLRMSEAKKDDISAAFLDEDKAKNILSELEKYRRELAESDGDSESPIHEMSKYSPARILGIIFPTGSEPSEKDDVYRSPDFDIKVEGTKVNVPVLNLDFSNNSRANIVKLVEVCYGLKMLVNDLEKAVKILSPENAGGNASRCSLNPTRVSADEEYINFIREKNLHRYANADRVDEYFTDKGKKLVPEKELKKTKKKADRCNLLLKEFVSRSEDTGSDKSNK